MTFEEFFASFRDAAPPSGTPSARRSPSREGLGTLRELPCSNARYWRHQQAGRAVATSSLATEWRALVEEMLRPAS